MKKWRGMLWYAVSGVYAGAAMVEAVSHWSEFVALEGRGGLYVLIAYLCYDKAERGPQ